jgi:hypothetical protein
VPPTHRQHDLVRLAELLGSQAPTIAARPMDQWTNRPARLYARPKMLNPASQVSDKAIASLAIVKVNFDHHQSILGNFAPLLRHCLADSPSSEVSAPELQEAILTDFGLELPQAVIKTLLRLQEQQGSVVREHGVYRIKRAQLDDAQLTALRTDALRRQASLIAAMCSYADDHFSRVWDDSLARSLLWTYLDAFSTAILATAVAGTPLPEQAPGMIGDLYVVHSFVLHAADADQQSFEFLETVVKGKMLADAVYLGEGAIDNRSQPLAALEVYFDGPILLYLLGRGGADFAAPYLELLTLLKSLGALPRCFEDSVVEAQQILDAAASRVASSADRHSFHGDIVATLVRTGKTRSDIELMSQRLVPDLLTLGIQTVTRPDAEVRLTEDESQLQSMLEQSVGYRNPRALTVDLDSLTAIHRLRGGRTARSLAKSRAVFVTHNYNLFCASARFFGQRRSGPAVPNCVLDSPFTTLVWLHQPLEAPQLPRDRIIADAYAAMNPSGVLWQEFNDEIGRLQEQGAISEDDAHLLRLSEESRQALMDQTLGDDEAYVEGTAQMVLERARSVAQSELRSEVATEKAARQAAERLVDDGEVAIQQRSQWVGRIVARAVFVIVVPLLVAGLIFGPLGPLNGSWTPLPTLVQIGCTALLLVLTFWGVVSGVSVSRLAGQLATLTERATAGVLKRLLRR